MKVHQPPQLTGREIEIMRLIIDPDLSLKAAAKLLSLDYGSLRQHLNRIYTKLDVTSRYQAIYKFLNNYPSIIN
jgi:DNA-binding CsgD family transcriptional regulator